MVLLFLLLFVVTFAAIAQRLKTPYPIILVLAGLLLGFIPRIPRVTLNPEVVFFVVLPPLLYGAAWNTPWRSFVKNFVGIASLAVGLVALTVFGVAAGAPWFLSGLDWRTGFVLGAVVATTDAIAATSIAKQLAAASTQGKRSRSPLSTGAALISFRRAHKPRTGGPVLDSTEEVHRRWESFGRLFAVHHL